MFQTLLHTEKWRTCCICLCCQLNMQKHEKLKALFQKLASTSWISSINFHIMLFQKCINQEMPIFQKDIYINQSGLK